MKSNKNFVNASSFFSICVSFFSFFVLNLPSVKAIFSLYFTISSPLFNLFALIGLYITGLLNCTNTSRINAVFTSIKLSRQKRDFILLWLSLYSILIASGLWSEHIVLLSIEPALQYLSVFLFVLGLTLFTQKEHIPIIIYLQIAWGAILSLMAINIDGILQGRNYAPLSMPLGASLVCCFALIFLNQSSLISKICWASVFLINLKVLVSWPGRASILFPVMIISFYLIFVFTPKIFSSLITLNKARLFKFITILIFLMFWGFYLLTNLSSEILESRLTRLFTNVSEEPRIVIYRDTFQTILDKPLFGHGLHTYQAIFKSIPHNIFLEVWVCAGIVGLIILSIILVQFICNAMIIIFHTYNSLALAFSLYTMFYLLIWNVLGELKDSYILFGAISIHLSNRYKYSIHKFNNINLTKNSMRHS